MELAVEGVIVVLLIVGLIGAYRGLNFRKLSGWLHILCPFVSGILAGLLRADLYGGMALGAMSTALIWYGGAMNQWQRQRAERMAGPWLARNEKNSAVAVLVRMLKKSLDK